MMKRGGRESGERKQGPTRTDAMALGEQSPARSDANTESTMSGRLAAANPAVCPLTGYTTHGDLDNGPWLREHDERIRALEAEIAQLKAHCCVKTRGGDYWARTPEEPDECHVERDCGV